MKHGLIPEKQQIITGNSLCGLNFRRLILDLDSHPRPTLTRGCRPPSGPATARGLQVERSSLQNSPILTETVLEPSLRCNVKALGRRSLQLVVLLGPRARVLDFQHRLG